MPEGDTIHRAAARLRPALEGTTIVRFEAPRLVGGHRLRPGDRITAVEAVGKHLLVHVERGLTLRTHMRMTGSWHLYQPGQRWQRPVHTMRVLLEVDSGWLAVCFAAPVVEVLPTVTPSPSVAALGPDLCLPDADLDVVLDRLDALAEPATSIAEVLLDQRVAAGIGNIFKSETLFACRVDPFTPVGAVDRDTRRRLYTTASRLLRANLTTASRRFDDGEPSVYGRHGRPCRRCGTPIAHRRHGAQARTTWWCPSCQPPAG